MKCGDRERLEKATSRAIADALKDGQCAHFLATDPGRRAMGDFLAPKGSH